MNTLNFHPTPIKDQCKKAKLAAPKLALLSSEIKNRGLTEMADEILRSSDDILSANGKDLERGRQEGMSPALLDRLRLTPERLKDISEAVRAIGKLKDPIGEVLSQWTMPNGLNISKVRVPLGVIGMIYEARPNVTADAIALGLKTGNSVVLRGSSSAYDSNRAILAAIHKAVQMHGINGEAFQLLEDTSREGVETFVQMDKYLNVVIPRGGASLIRKVVEKATVPTIETGIGNCHVYVDETANLQHAAEIILNSKVQRPSVCNSAETLLVHKKVSTAFLTDVIPRLVAMGVEIRGDSTTRVIYPKANVATEFDWQTEYLDLILAIKVVDSLDEAIAHIHRFGTMHTEVIVSETPVSIERFVNEIDAAAVMVNASSRFTDGGEFGFGAEIGISTQKLHARGPMGLAELTSYKYIVRGTGQVRG